MIQLSTVAASEPGKVSRSSDWQTPHIGRGGWRLVPQLPQRWSSSVPDAMASQ